MRGRGRRSREKARPAERAPAGGRLTIAPRRGRAGEPSTRRGSRCPPGRAAGAGCPGCRPAPSAGTATAGAAGRPSPQPPSPSRSSAWLRPAAGRRAPGAGFPPRSAPPPCPAPPRDGGSPRPALPPPPAGWARAGPGQAAPALAGVGASPPDGGGVARPRRFLPRSGRPPLPSQAPGVGFLPAPSAPTGVLRKGHGPRDGSVSPGRAGHGPVGRRHPDPRPRRGSEGLGPAPLSSPHLTSAAVHLPGGRRGGAAGGRPGGGGERFGGRGRRESQRAFPKNSPPTFPPQLPLKRPGPVSSVSCSRSPSPLSTSRGAPAKRRPIFGGGGGGGELCVEAGVFLSDFEKQSHYPCSVSLPAPSLH